MIPKTTSTPETGFPPGSDTVTTRESSNVAPISADWALPTVSWIVVAAPTVTSNESLVAEVSPDAVAVALLLAIHFWRVRKDGGISGPM